MRYLINYTERAVEDIKFYNISGQIKLANKILKLLDEIEENPRKGTGKPEPLKENLAGLWSRRIDKKNRLIYRINDSIITVLVISARGHYNDK
jgi:toxin YoeB